MIKQIVRFDAPAQVIYDALMDEKKHSDFTGAKAKIANHIGGTFSVWDGYAQGKHVALVPGKKIVQTWQASDWPKDAVSKVTFSFKPTENGSELEMVHEDIPKEFENDIAQGWKDYYWKPLKAYIANQK
jgi:activator of HSP90 ATPase